MSSLRTHPLQAQWQVRPCSPFPGRTTCGKLANLSTPPFPVCKIGIRVWKSILITQRFRICKFAHLLKFTYNPQINTQGTFMIILEHMQSDERFESPEHTFLAEAEQGCALPSCFSFHVINKYSFCGKLLPRFLHFCTFCWKLFCLKWPPRMRSYGQEGCYVSLEANSCVKWVSFSCSAVGHEFHVYESTMD